jgi:ABC-type dipeptide/oligopeptide/nickel transport system permease subunit
MTKRSGLALVSGALILFAAWTALLVIGLRIPDRWATDQWAGGFIGENVTLAPFPPWTDVKDFPLNDPSSSLVDHFYIFGSDAGGRDLLALTARGALPSLAIVVVALLVRVLLGLGAGALIAAGVEPVRGIARAAGGWVSGFPYLALAVLIIQAFTGGPSAPVHPGPVRVVAFVVAISAVGWRDIAELVANRLTWVGAQTFAMGARALGADGLGYFRRHVWPYLRPALAVELSFQAASVLVLLAELGFLQYYIAGFVPFSEDTMGVAAFRLATQPDLGQLVSDASLYLLRQQFAPILVPALALALAALGFELLGRAMRGRADLPA